MNGREPRNDALEAALARSAEARTSEVIDEVAKVGEKAWAALEATGPLEPPPQLQAQLDAQRARVQAIQASRNELLFSPQGLRGLFPSNKVSVKITSKQAKRDEALARRTSTPT